MILSKQCLGFLALLPLMMQAMPSSTGAISTAGRRGATGVFVFGFAPDADLVPLSVVYMSVESSPGGDACYFSYWPSYNLIYLVGPPQEAVTWLTPGATSIAQNSRCSISGASSSASIGPDGELSVSVSLTFKNTFPNGLKPLWGAAIDAVGRNSGWQQMSGSYFCVRDCPPSNQNPIVQAITPPNRAGGFETFSFGFTDADGVSDLSTLQVLINSTLGSLNACNFTFDPRAAGGTGALYLVNHYDPILPPSIQTVLPGQSADAANSRCSIRGSDLFVSRTATSLTLRVSIFSYVSGANNIYAAAQDQQTGNSGWNVLGSWTPPSALQSIIQVDPSCQNAASCTWVGQLVQPLDPVQSSLWGFVSLQATGPANTVYSSISISRYRVPSCNAGTGTWIEGDISTGGPTAPALPPGAVSVGPPISASGRQAPYYTDFVLGIQTPGFHFSRVQFQVTATLFGQPLTPKTFTFQSNCVRVGDVPLITGVRDDLSGQVDAIDRGTEGPYLQLYGSRFAGVLPGALGASIQPGDGVSQWGVSYLNPAIGRANITYSLGSTAPTGQRLLTLNNGAGASRPARLFITDPTPVLDSVNPPGPWSPGQNVLITLTGKGFGNQPGVDLVVSDGGDEVACLGSGQVNIVSASDSTIQFSKSIPQSSPGCEFNINVTSNGLGGSFFTGPAASPKLQKASRPGSVQKEVTRLAVKVFVVHGIGDSGFGMADLASSLRVTLSLPPYFLDGRFDIDHGFSYGTTRGINCQELVDIPAALRAYTLSKSVPFQRLVFVGHSMGGLIIREMMRQGGLGANSRRSVAGLITLGTPHLGYPYLGIDEQEKCGNQASAMNSYLLSGGSLDDPTVLKTDFLRTLRSDWSIADFGNRFFAASGAVCSAQTRSFPGFGTNGCRAANPPQPGNPTPAGFHLSDGVVCQDSAGLVYPDAQIAPTERFNDPAYQYRHSEFIGYTIANVLCPNPPGGAGQSLSNPDRGGALVVLLTRFLARLYE